MAGPEPVTHEAPQSFAQRAEHGKVALATGRTEQLGVPSSGHHSAGSRTTD
jgi:hypothetical protein